MMRLRRSLICWYVSLIGVVLASVLAVPGTASGCEFDACAWWNCSCVGPCRVVYYNLDFYLQWECLFFICYDGTCAQLDGGWDDCVYLCCTDHVQGCCFTEDCSELEPL
jgi:hypothetical protein